MHKMNQDYKRLEIPEHNFFQQKLHYTMGKFILFSGVLWGLGLLGGIMLTTYINLNL